MTYRPSGLLLCSSFLSSLLVSSHAAAAQTATTSTPVTAITSTTASTHTTPKATVRKGTETIQVIHQTTPREAEQVIVTAHLDRARSELSPTTGASVYRFSRQALENIPGGDNAPLNQVLLQAPGVAQDSYGQIHVRGDHNEVQFRLDGVQLPEGLNVFGQALMTRFANNMSLTTGALPSQFGFLQAAVVDITTKNGTTNPGGNLSFYGGARDYFFPSLQYGFHKGKWDFFATADFVHDRVGIENTTSSFNAPHDLSNQYHFLGHARYTVDEDTRISLIAGISNAEYQLPNNPGQDWNHDYTPPANVTPSSNNLNEHQKQITDFAVLALQKEIGAFSLQDSVFTRYSSLRYSPDPTGDLYYFGNAQRAARSVFSTGTQHDVTWRAARNHTVRFGLQAFVERNVSNTTSTVFPQLNVTPNTPPIYGTTPIDVYDSSGKTGMVYGIYAQDEWRPLRNLTINYGLRFDGVSEYTSEHQFSPRVNLVWKPWKDGTLHAGYSRYFTPPPFEIVSGASLSNLYNTSGKSNSLTNDKVRAERDHYFDAGFDQTLLPGWHIAFDAYYKLAKNLIDEGQFGAPIILSGFNYRHGQVNGYEVSTSYDRGPLSLYGNFAWSRAIGKKITSAQFNFEQSDLNYISNRWVHLDHDQRWTASAGAAYTFFHKTRAPLRLSATMVYGSGLRADDEANDIPNGLALTPYATVNFSAVQTIHNTFGTAWAGDTQLRLDVINLGDHTYLLRDGSGIGVTAPQYGLRRTILCGISQGF